MGDSVWEVARILLKYIEEGATKGSVEVKKKKKPANISYLVLF